MRGVAAAILAGCLLLAAGWASAQERHLYTLTLHHALPEQVLPALEAQLGPGSSITGYHQQLILNATAGEYQTVRTLLLQLDRAPRSLLISVRDRNHSDSQRQRYGVEGSGAVQVHSGDGRYRDAARVVIDHNSNSSDSDGTRRVRAVEGMAAFISTGNVYLLRGGTYGERSPTTVDSGFYATARVLDDGEVVVDIDQHNDALADGGIDTQALRTQVRGRLGEWIDIGAVNGGRSAAGSGLTGYQSDSAATAAGIAIKVEQAD